MHRTHANIGNWIEVKLISQGGKCAICNGVMARVNIDHSHKTGKRRGLLCTSCNTSLGKFKDSPEILMNAINYLLLFE